jgi:hypothetical protein
MTPRYRGRAISPAGLSKVTEIPGTTPGDAKFFYRADGESWYTSTMYMDRLLGLTVTILLGTGCVSLQAAPANTKQSRPDIYMAEGQATWIGLGRPVGKNTKIILIGPGLNVQNQTEFAANVRLVTNKGRTFDCVRANEGPTNCWAGGGQAAASGIEIEDAKTALKSAETTLKNAKTALKDADTDTKAAAKTAVRDAKAAVRDAQTAIKEAKKGWSRVASVIILPKSADDFDGSEAICLLGPLKRGCARPARARLYRPIRVVGKAKQTTSEQPNPEQPNPEQPNPEQPNRGQTNPEQPNTVADEQPTTSDEGGDT